MLELAVLGLLKEQPLHGYALRKLLTQRLGAFWRVSFGSLYPTLRKLERAGAVERVRDDGGGRRRRQVYRITSQGEQQFLSLLEAGDSGGWEEEKFPLRLAFFRYLRPETRIRLLERRRAELVQRLGDSRASLERAYAEGTDGYVVALIRHGVERTEADVAWLDHLIAAERALASGGDAGAEPPSADSAGHGAPAVPDDEISEDQLRSR